MPAGTWRVLGMRIPNESVRTLSLQSTSTRPLFSNSLSRARFPLLAAQNAALASGVSFCRNKMKQDLEINIRTEVNMTTSTQIYTT